MIADPSRLPNLVEGESRLVTIDMRKAREGYEISALSVTGSPSGLTFSGEDVSDDDWPSFTVSGGTAGNDYVISAEMTITTLGTAIVKLNMQVV